jgi:hypothetical protein
VGGCAAKGKGEGLGATTCEWTWVRMPVFRSRGRVQTDVAAAVSRGGIGDGEDTGHMHTR